MSSAFNWTAYWIIEVKKWKHFSGHVIQYFILRMKKLRLVQDPKANSCRPGLSPLCSSWPHPYMTCEACVRHLRGQRAKPGVVSPYSRFDFSCVPQAMHSVKMVNILPMVWVLVVQTGWRSSSWKSMVPKSFQMCLKESSSAVWLGRMMGRECFITHTPNKMEKVMVS